MPSRKKPIPSKGDKAMARHAPKGKRDKGRAGMSQEAKILAQGVAQQKLLNKLTNRVITVLAATAAATILLALTAIINTAILVYQVFIL